MLRQPVVRLLIRQLVKLGAPVNFRFLECFNKPSDFTTLHAPGVETQYSKYRHGTTTMCRWHRWEQRWQAPLSLRKLQLTRFHTQTTKYRPQNVPIKFLSQFFASESLSSVQLLPQLCLINSFFKRSVPFRSCELPLLSRSQLSLMQRLLPLSRIPFPLPMIHDNPSFVDLEIPPLLLLLLTQ